jgi:peptidyl-prolyl cis-trans isomerase B (cyclophilin B)
MALLSLGAPSHAEEDPAPRLVAPVVGTLVLDGRLDDAGWGRALVLSVESVDAPEGPPAYGTRLLEPRVRIALASNGCLVLGVEAAEPPGASIGVSLLCVADSASGAADATAVAYAPLEVRTPSILARGPRGTGADACRADGAVDASRPGQWSLELSLVPADLAPTPDATLHLAITVFTRTPNLPANSPPGSRWSEPAAWLALSPPSGGWPQQALIAEATMERRRKADVEAREHWIEYLGHLQAPPPMDSAPELARTWLEETLLAPLQAVEAARPELRPALGCLRGDLHWRLGLLTEAEAEYEGVLSASPGWREALFGRYLKIEAQRLASGPPGGPTDWGSALARTDPAALPALATPQRAPWLAEAAKLARGLLHYRRGEFEPAARLLDELAARFPHAAWIRLHAHDARRGAEEWPAEQLRWSGDGEAGLPRARLRTSRGVIEIELFQQDAPNTVNHFVWLATHGFYDGLTFHRTEPGCFAEGGDPFTRSAGTAHLAGSGGPGYGLRTEESERRPFRGTVMLSNAGRDTEGSRFVLLLGSALHLSGEHSVFGRITSGLEVAEALQAGDRIQAVDLANLTEGWTYRPQDDTGSPAPEPRDPTPR